MAVLELLAGPGLGHLYELDPDGTVVGRHHGCDVMIDERRISRRHVWIYRDGNHYFVEDLHSSNGTYINGQRIETPRMVSDGDELKIHRTCFRFHESAPATIGDRPTTITGSIPVEIFEIRHTENNPADKLKAIIRLSKNLSQSVTLDDVLMAVLNSMFEVFPQAERAFILLPDSDGELRIRSCKMRSEELFDVTSARPVNRNVATQVMKTGEALLSMDALSDQQRDTTTDGEEASIRAVICAPLVDGTNRPAGLIHLDTLNAANSFDMNDLELLATAAIITGQTIQNSSLHLEKFKAEIAEYELHLAKEVQQLLVPHDEPNMPGYEFYHDYEPARELGGDYIDYIELADGRIVFAVGDVAGRSAAAALLMARLNAAFRVALKFEDDLGKAVSVVSQELIDLHVAGRFVTCVLCLLDPRKNTLSIVNAGHVAPMIRRADRTISRFPSDKQSTPLGVNADATYESVDWDFHPGDALLLVTDGVSEAVNDKQEMYGDTRLAKAFKDAPAGADAIGKTLVDDIHAYIGNQISTEDICVFVMSRA